jgi:putative membrane protein
MRHPDVPGRSLRCVEMENGIIRTKDLWRFIMEFFGNIIKGVMIGIANIIPGVSGGTMAVSLGIYDRLIGAVSGLFKEFKKSIAFLIPIIIGCGIGIVGFTYAIEYLLDKHTFVTCMAFVGLILGGLPAIISSMKSKMTSGGIGVFGILAFVIAFVISGGMPLLKESKDALTVIAVTPVNMVILFILGVVASATMVIPGVSGSMMLMIFGYYYAIINTIKTFLDNLRAFDLMGMKDGILLLAPFGIGVILGIFLIAKLITFLFEKYGVQTFCAILGLVISSPIAIFINTGLVSKLGSLSIWEILFGIVLMGAGAFVTVFVGEK